MRGKMRSNVIFVEICLGSQIVCETGLIAPFIIIERRHLP